MKYYIERDYMGKITVTFPRNLSDEIKETLKYGAHAFSFLLERNEKLSLHNFAMRINKIYDCSEGKNKIIMQLFLNMGE